MRRPSDEVVQAMAAINRQYPLFVEWLYEWRLQEFEQLPSVTTNVATAQGRCQVLSEICKLVKNSPELVAKSR
jgi:hypothetical protein